MLRRKGWKGNCIHSLPSFGLTLIHHFYDCSFQAFVQLTKVDRYHGVSDGPID